MSNPNSNVSYPTTYAGVRNTTYTAYSSAAAVGAPVPAGYTAGYSPFPSFDTVTGAAGTTGADGNTGAADPTTTPKGGRGGSKGKRSSGAPKVFSCANKHPCNAIRCLRPDSKFEMVCSYATTKGSALVYTIVADNVTYQGEGTSGSIAKAIAATKALAGINAFEHHLVQKVADYEEQKQLVMERIETWQKMQQQKEQAKEERRKNQEEALAKQQAAKQANKKKKENNGDSTPMDTTDDKRRTMNPMNYGRLIHTYGPDVTFAINEAPEKNEIGSPTFSCELKVQGFSFTGNGTSKKSAKSEAVAKAFELFTVSPPPVVKIIGEKKRKLPKNKVGSEFKPIEPVEFQDKLAEKCWNFVSEQIEAVRNNLTRRRNLVVMVKVDGEETLENCEVVSYGAGTFVVKKDNMSADGNTIHDSTGESLAIKSFRKYLMSQIESAIQNKTSIYIKERNGRFALKKKIKFFLYTNSSSMGDCRAKFIEPPTEAKQESMEVEGSTESKETTSAAATTETKMEGTEETSAGEKVPKRQPFRKGFRRFNRPPISTPVADLGKIQVYGCRDNDATEFTISEVKPDVSYHKNVTKHCIVSPSDKLARMQITGVQGSMLSMISNPVFISKHFINRAFDAESVKRALFDRVNGVKPNFPNTPEPTFTGVAWRASRLTEFQSPFSFTWAKDHHFEVIHAPTGKKIDIAETSNVNMKEIGKEIGEPSVYSTRALYNVYTTICTKLRKPVQKYSAIIASNDKYTSVKKAVHQHLEKNGMGTWPTKSVSPDF